MELLVKRKDCALMSLSQSGPGRSIFVCINTVLYIYILIGAKLFDVLIWSEHFSVYDCMIAWWTIELFVKSSLFSAILSVNVFLLRNAIKVSILHLCVFL